MASVPDVAGGGVNIMVPLLGFLGGPSPHNPVVDQAVVSLLVVLPMAYFAGVIVEHFAIVVLEAYLHLAAAAQASSVCLGQLVVLVFTLVFAWLIVVAVQLAAFDFLRRRYARDWAGVQLERAGLNPP